MRTSESQVRDIFDTNLDDASLVQHIRAANTIVDEVAQASNLGSERLEMIEMYLAAHYASVQDPRVTSESVGSASYDYQQTEYLQMAKTLDPTGVVDQQDQEFEIYVSEGR